MRAKFIAVTGALALICAASQASANLIINGSFEVGTGNPGFGGFADLNGGDTSISGWTVTGGSIDWINGYWQAQDGTHSIDLNGVSVGGLQQTINTVLGQKYRLTFYLSGNPDPFIDGFPNTGAKGGTRTLDVSAGSTIQPFQYAFTVPPNSGSNMLWQKESMVFTGTGAKMTISFVSTTTSNCCWGPALDNVSVSAVPELSTWVMMLLGFAGIGIAAHYRMERHSRVGALSSMAPEWRIRRLG